MIDFLNQLHKIKTKLKAKESMVNLRLKIRPQLPFLEEKEVVHFQKLQTTNHNLFSHNYNPKTREKRPLPAVKIKTKAA